MIIIIFGRTNQTYWIVYYGIVYQYFGGVYRIYVSAYDTPILIAAIACTGIALYAKATAADAIISPASPASILHWVSLITLK